MADIKSYISGLSTLQIVSVAIAAVLVLIFVVTLLIMRSRRDDGSDIEPEDSALESLMDGPPHDESQSFDRPADVAPSAAVPAAAPLDSTPSGVAPSGADLGYGQTLGAEPSRESVGESPAVVPAATPEPPPPLTAAAAAADLDVTPVADAFAALTGAPAVQSPKHMVPLSDIIVTTSNKMVDLEDPEVRRMLKDLASYEIDQAAHSRQLGQDLDAVLQLTEAEKICHALGMETYARQIHEMMEGLQA